MVARGGATVAASAAVAQYGIQYNGGPVIPSAKVVAIYWANSTIYSGGPTPGTTGTGAAGTTGGTAGTSTGGGTLGATSGNARITP